MRLHQHWKTILRHSWSLWRVYFFLFLVVFKPMLAAIKVCAA
jgi:hypothetical protein